jgi:hypothetical protein
MSDTESLAKDICQAYWQNSMAGKNRERIHCWHKIGPLQVCVGDVSCLEINLQHPKIRNRSTHFIPKKQRQTLCKISIIDKQITRVILSLLNGLQ